MENGFARGGLFTFSTRGGGGKTHTHPLEKSKRRPNT